MMILEVLYPELALELGDVGNVRLLIKLFPGCEVVRTHAGDTPRFTRGESDFVYMGDAEESNLNRILEMLRPFREDLKREIARGTRFFLTGNAMEILGDRIEDPELGGKDGLGLYPFSLKRSYRKRKNGFAVGKTADGMEVCGILGTFSTISYAKDCPVFLTLDRATGNSEFPSVDGIADGGLIATTLQGPVLTMNSGLLKYLAKANNCEVPDSELFRIVEDNAELLHSLMKDPTKIAVYEA